MGVQGSGSRGKWARARTRTTPRARARTRTRTTPRTGLNLKKPNLPGGPDLSLKPLNRLLLQSPEHPGPPGGSETGGGLFPCFPRRRPREHETKRTHTSVVPGLHRRRRPAEFSGADSRGLRFPSPRDRRRTGRLRLLGSEGPQNGCPSIVKYCLDSPRSPVPFVEHHGWGPSGRGPGPSGRGRGPSGRGRGPSGRGRGTREGSRWRGDPLCLYSSPVGSGVRVSVRLRWSARGTTPGPMWMRGERCTGKRKGNSGEKKNRFI